MSGSNKFRNPEAYKAFEIVTDAPCEARALYCSVGGSLEFIPAEDADAITLDLVEGVFPVFVYQVNSATTATILGLD